MFPKLNLILLLFFIQCNSKIEKKLQPYYNFSDETEMDLILQKESEKRGIDFYFSKSVLIKESHYQKQVISSTGAIGLMQLMPRSGSYFSENYKNFELARKQKDRIYKEKTAQVWIDAYRKELQDILSYYAAIPLELYKKDRRFDPEYNIRSGVGQLAEEYKFFLSRKHSEYKSRILAAAAYNAGRYSVIKKGQPPAYDSIPINTQTEYYSIAVEKVYEILKKNTGRLPKDKLFLLY
jgi:soluble lytic murein transglycosylase-like protein